MSFFYLKSTLCCLLLLPRLHDGGGVEGERLKMRGASLRVYASRRRNFSEGGRSDQLASSHEITSGADSIFRTAGTPYSTATKRRVHSTRFLNQQA